MRRNQMHLKQLRSVAVFTGDIIAVLGALMVVPLITSALAEEWNVVVDFILSMGLTISIGLVLILWGESRNREDLTWSQGMIVVAASWLIGMVVAALPYRLSGYWLSYLDAAFDVMSGLTTTGLTLVQDLDHLPLGLNMWRHILTWLGGQGMVVLALTFLVRSLPGAFRLYVGEGKDERLAPNVVNTARAIWYISVVYLIVGTLVLWLVTVLEGIPPARGFFHALWVFMAAWSTGGFAPQSQNIVYYHSLPFELATMVFFILGSVNFNLHWAVWTGNRRELYKNLEAVTFAITSTVLSFLAIWALGRAGVYSDAVSLFRRIYYTLISAHTTTGFGTTYARQFVLEWGSLPLVAITVAMLFGGFASSTAGGFKVMRIGIAAKALIQDIRRLLAPDSAIVIQRFHAVRDLTLNDRLVRSAMTVIVIYMLLWGITTAVTASYGYDLASSVFEAASVTGNVGLSAGVTAAAMPWTLKALYLFVMWLGRLEFTAVWVFFGYILRLVRGR